MSLGAYEVFQATGKLPEPVWPEQSLQELLRIAFQDNFITTLKPVLGYNLGYNSPFLAKK